MNTGEASLERRIDRWEERNEVAERSGLELSRLEARLDKRGEGGRLEGRGAVALGEVYSDAGGAEESLLDSE